MTPHPALKGFYIERLDPNLDGIHYCFHVYAPSQYLAEVFSGIHVTLGAKGMEVPED